MLQILHRIQSEQLRTRDRKRKNNKLIQIGLQNKIWKRNLNSCITLYVQAKSTTIETKS